MAHQGMNRHLVHIIQREWHGILRAFNREQKLIIFRVDLRYEVVVPFEALLWICVKMVRQVFVVRFSGERELR